MSARAVVAGWFRVSVWGLAWRFGLAMPCLVAAQQAPNWSLYQFNRVVLNPAFTGYQEATNFTLAGRTQWVGIEGAPRSVSLAFSRPTPKLRGAVSAYVLNDQVGPLASTEVKLGYAFRLPVGSQGTALQIGVNGGGISRSLDGSRWRPPDAQEDPLFVGSGSQFVPDFGVGLALLGPDDRWWVGAGANHVTEPVLNDLTGSEDGFVIGRLIHLAGGFRVQLSRDVELLPSTYVRLSGGQWQVDASVSVQAYPVIAGVSYRLDDAAVGLVGLQVSSRLFVAYAYDYVLSNLNARTSGSHEIVVSYTLPRFFRFSAPTLTPYDKGRFR